MLELIVLILSVLANLILAIAVFAKDPRRLVNRYFTFFTATLIGWTITHYFSIHPIIFDQLFWIRLDLAWGAIMSMALLLLTNIFPVEKAYFRKIDPFVVAVGITIAALALSPWLFTSIDYSSGSAQPVPGPGIVPFGLFVIGSLVLSVIILLRRLFTSKGKTKEYVRYAIAGVTVTFSFLVIFNFVFVIAFQNTSFIVFTPAISLLFTASFAYGMIRAKLFDLRLIIARFVAYILLLLAIGVTYGFIAAALSFLIVGVRPSFTQIMVSTVVVGLLVLFVEPLRKFFNHITREVFYQDDYDTKNVLDDIASVLVRSTETELLANGTMTILKNALKAEFITLVLLGTEGQEKRISVGHGTPSLSSITSQELQRHIVDMMSIDTVENLSKGFHREIQKSGVSVVIRLETKSEVVGYCLFGYKTTGGTYSERDIDLIRIASGELAVAIQNTLRFEQIQKFNDTLQQRIEDATKELRATNEQLQKLDTAKDEFVSMASHQLRTPLTSVKGYISMVLEGDVGKITPTQRQMLSEAFTSSERMVHLIGDFLNVSRLQTGKFMLEKKPVDLTKLVSQEIDSLETTIKAHGLKLNYRKPSHFPVLMLDEAKIRQVLMNFIDNAIFYSQEGTTITVKLSIEDGYVVVRVIDTGIGVPKSEQPHLFTKFFRASNARRQRPDGTGIGLFLAKKVITSHGGTIVFESQEGKGSTFGLRLPIKRLQVPEKDS